jgi:hypothetical protein
VSQSLPRSIAAGIVEVVADDAECRRLIPVVSAYNVAQRSAGSARNFTNMAMEGMAAAAEFISTPSGMHGDNAVHRQSKAAKEWWQSRGDALACDKIADATAAAIDRQVGKRLPKWVCSAAAVSREPKRQIGHAGHAIQGWLAGEVTAYHSATGVTVGNGKVYVFDWHETLALRCPVIYRTLDDWMHARDEYGALFSTFQGWG